MQIGHDRGAAKTRRRLVTVSVVQFFASVCIMLRHYTFFLEPHFPLAAAAFSNVTFSDFFFCCSGFFLHYVNANKDSVEVAPLLKKRFARLYPLHLATTLFYVVILVMSAHLGSLGNTRSGWDCVIPTLTLTHAFGTVDRQCLDYPSWFLSALFALYITYPFVRRVIRARGVGIVVATIAGLVIAYEAAYRLADYPQWTTLSYDFGVLRGVPTFLSGIVIAEMLPSLENRVPSFRPAYAAFALSLVGMMASLEPLIFQAALPVALVALLAGAEAGGAASFLRNRRLASVGSWSFPLYLIHVPIAAVLLNFLFVRLLHLEGVSIVVAVIGTAIVAVAASWFMHKVLDDWMRQWTAARRPSTA